MKKFLCIPLLVMSGFAHAAPNVWVSGWGQGFAEYSIRDTKGNTLWVTCNVGAGDDYDHSARLETPKSSYQNTNSKYPLTFVLDGKKNVAAPETTKWRNGANAWYEFSQGVAKAKKIDVFLNNKKVTTFTPTPQSIRAVAKEISTCESMF
ncbi:hypothetical protein [Acinetobacter sp. CFCC 10889]|uniref:hypothetical protein n=1 Tax=Acinetobacter sp. CFCC 10889 TaxID=1775557 RepID=UPI000DCFDE4B|nr:hypothetical protein [Acinetobacter sp. CFCC 10889]